MVQWLEDAKTRARFALSGRDEWKVEHIDALMQLLGEIRAEMAPSVPDKSPVSSAIPTWAGVERRRIVESFATQEVQRKHRPAPKRVVRCGMPCFICATVRLV